MTRTTLLSIMLFLVAPLLSGFAPQPIPMAQSDAAPGCMDFVYLPMVTGGKAGGRAQQAAATTAHGAAAKKADFNGDGCADLAIGIPSEIINSGSRHGAVQVVHGGAFGLTAAGNQVWHRGGGYDAAGNLIGDLIADLRDNDAFGSSLATGDFNKDGKTDLAIGVPLAEASGKVNAGAVHVLYGSEQGLIAQGNQFWSQSGGWVDAEGDGNGVWLGDLYGGPEDDDRFGNALASGDFNRDGFADLAIGVFKEDIGSIDAAGAVNVIYGSPDGLTWVGNQMWHQNGGQGEVNGTDEYVSLGDILGGAEADDWFGNALAAADFNDDGADDLAIGAYGEALNQPSPKLEDAGAIHIVLGGESGLRASGNQHFHQRAAYVDTTGNGAIDIDLGNPTGTEEANDWFGFSLAAGNFDGDRYADLAVGVPHEDLYVNGSEQTHVGTTHVFYGSASGLHLSDQQWVQQNTIYTNGSATGNLLDSLPENGDNLGHALGAGDLNGDGFGDLILGVPGESTDSGVAKAGAAMVLFGTSEGVGSAGQLWISQDLTRVDGSEVPGLSMTPEANDELGAALHAADLNRDGVDELVVGIPDKRSISGVANAGAIIVVPGGRSGLRVPYYQRWAQDGGYDRSGTYLGDLYGGPDTNDEFGWALP